MTLFQTTFLRTNTIFNGLCLWYTMKVNTKYRIQCYFFSKINLIIYEFWQFFIAIKPVKPPVGPATLPVHSWIRLFKLCSRVGDSPESTATTTWPGNRAYAMHASAAKVSTKYVHYCYIRMLQVEATVGDPYNSVQVQVSKYKSRSSAEMPIVMCHVHRFTTVEGIDHA
jgi:hypothetical protein